MEHTSSSNNNSTQSETSSHFGTKVPVEKFTESQVLAIRELSESLIGKTVQVQGRLSALRGQGKIVFIALRQGMSKIQGVLFKSETITNEMLKFVRGIPLESFIEVEGILNKANTPITSTTHPSIELSVSKLFLISKSGQLPFTVEEASRPETFYDQQISTLEAKIASEGETPELQKELHELYQLRSLRVSQHVRLEYRVLDLRTAANQGIFRLQSAMCNLFREFLTQKDFTEIHTPKLLESASEGGSSVFAVQYFNRKAYLAQSPQFHKQMAISADFERVFEITPVFRAENANTYRHLTEFVGLDMEMQIKEHYHEALNMLKEMLIYMFENLEKRYSNLISIVSQHYKIEPLVYKPALVLEYSQGVALLREAGIEMEEFGDLSTVNERTLGKIVKEKYETDFFVLDQFPANVRPFYTMPSPKKGYANAYDFFVRGQEIMSGAQRIHTREILEASCKEKGVAPETIKPYLESFNYGTPMHAGGGIGLERLLMLYLGLSNIRNASMFPRDPHRLAP